MNKNLAAARRELLRVWPAFRLMLLTRKLNHAIESAKYWDDIAERTANKGRRIAAATPPSLYTTKERT